jgi:polar amino acid transport system substrate-binding protein
VRRLVPLLLLFAPDASAGRLPQIRAAGELRWGSDAQGGAPYVFQDPMDPNHTIGFEVDFADALAQKLALRARPVQGQWDQLLELLKRGDFDVAINGIEVADEKKRVCLLSHPYYAAAEKLTVRKNDATAPRNLEAVRGRRVGTLPGSLAERILTRAGADVKTYNGGQNEIYDDLRLGRTDAVLLDEPITKFYGEVERELEVVDGVFGNLQYAVAVPADDPELLEVLDRAIDALAREGKLRAIYEHWGLWNAETAALFHENPSPRVKIAEAWESWRVAVGKSPPFWERVRDRYPRMQPLFARGAALTLALSLSSMALAILLGVTLALGRTFGPMPVQWLCTLYVEFVRGTPLLVQLIMIYFGLPELGLKLEPFTAGWLALGLNYAAAEAENYRAGLLSVPAAQREAAWSLGLGKWQTIWHVVAPQAIRVSLPPVTNDFIALLKDSSLVALVTMVELDKTYMNLASSTRDHLGLGVVVALWYLLLGLPFARLARYTEERMSRKLRKA